ncbi:MAG: hypothetical protein KC613_25395, partial [Myxococcales bacterium]|nr:hypothetical protein [Myxococcales bacterium]
ARRRGPPRRARGNGAGGDSAGVLCVETTLDAPAEAFTVGQAGAGAAAHLELNASAAPAGRAGALVNCGP